VPEQDQGTWRAFAADFGLLFQIVDDLLDGDGLVQERGVDAVWALAEETEERTRATLAEIPADTARLDELVSGLSMRARAS
jgi:hypothetical protein